MTEHVRVGVIGAGIMGANHARVARNIRGGSLTVVIDPDLERARTVAGPGVPVAAVASDVLDEFDLAVIAVPTAAHCALAIELLAAGKHVLVEKPIAATVDEADSMIAAAAEARRVLAVGHVERFNAATRELPTLLDDPIHVKAVRVSPYSPRISDGVVHDLMIHDLDIALSLADGSPVTAVSGIGRAVHGELEDLAHATVTFASGLTASFETSRLAQQKVRTIELTQADSAVVADLVRQDITVHRMSRHEYLADDGVRYRQSSVVEIPFIDQRGEPLQRELEDVVASIIEDRAPVVEGRHGRDALELADRVAAALVRS